MGQVGLLVFSYICTVYVCLSCLYNSIVLDLAVVMFIFVISLNLHNHFLFLYLPPDLN